MVKIDELCPVCGAHLRNWEEVFAEKHECLDREATLLGKTEIEKKHSHFFED